MKKTLALLMALSVIMTMTACQNDTSEEDVADTSPTIQTSPPHPEPYDPLPDIELDNAVVKWLSPFSIDYIPGGNTPPSLALFETKYDGKIEWIKTTDESKFTDLASLVMSSSSPDLFPADNMDTHPMGAIKGLFAPIDEYIDFSSDLWEDAAGFCDKFTYKGKHYVAVADIEPSCICIYNKDTIEACGFDDPAKLLRDGKWNWNAFEKMCTEFTYPDFDWYALDGWNVEKGIMTSAGVPLIDVVDDTIVSNVMHPAIEKVQNLMYNLQQNSVLYPRHLLNDGSIRDGIEGAGIASGLQLFCIADSEVLRKPLSETKQFGDISDGYIMFVPMPKDPELDYYPIWSKIKGFNIVSGAQNPQGAAAYINCRRFIATDIYVEELNLHQLEKECGWTPEMCDMLYEIKKMAYQNPVFDFSMSVSDELSSQTDMLTRAVMIPGEKTWDEARDEYAQSIDTLVAEANNALQH